VSYNKPEDPPKFSGLSGEFAIVTRHQTDTPEHSEATQHTLLHRRMPERINSGLDEARRKGVILGRPKGSTLDRKVFLQTHKDIIRHLKDGQSVRNTAKITGKGVSTVQRVKAALVS